MKKILFLALTVLFTISMNAQGLSVSLSASQSDFVRKAKVSQKTMAVSTETMNNASNKMGLSSKLNNVNSVAGIDALCGKYIEDVEDEENGITNGQVCLFEKVIIKNAGETVEAVKMQGNFYGFCDSGIAYYDEGENTLTIPAESIVSTLTDNSGNSYDGIIVSAYFEGGYIKEKLNEDNEPEDIVFDIEEEDGSIILKMRNSGWAIYAVDGDGVPFAAPAYGEDYVINKANAVYKCELRTPAGNAWGQWQDIEDEVYVENYGSFATIHGLLGSINFDVDLDEDEHTLTLHNLAPAQMINTQEGSVMSYLTLTRVADGYINHVSDPDATMEGYYNNGYMMFGVPTSATEFEPYYFYICSEIDAEGFGYFVGLVGALEITPNSLLADGIHSATVASTKSGMKFNLAGQRVADSYKGISVLNGKKYINK